MTLDELSWWYAEVMEVVKDWAGIEANAALFGRGSG